MKYQIKKTDELTDHKTEHILNLWGVQIILPIFLKNAYLIIKK